MWVKTFIQALQECQNTKMKKIHLGNHKFPPNTGRPNCLILAVRPACARWELLIPQMNFFHFGVLAFLQGLYKCFHQNFPSNFFLPYVSFKPTVNRICRHLSVCLMINDFTCTKKKVNLTNVKLKHLSVQQNIGSNRISLNSDKKCL